MTKGGKRVGKVGQEEEGQAMTKTERERKDVRECKRKREAEYEKAREREAQRKWKRAEYRIICLVSERKI